MSGTAFSVGDFVLRRLVRCRRRRKAFLWKPNLEKWQPFGLAVAADDEKRFYGNRISKNGNRLGWPLPPTTKSVSMETESRKMATVWAGRCRRQQKAFLWKPNLKSWQRTQFGS